MLSREGPTRCPYVPCIATSDRLRRISGWCRIRGVILDPSEAAIPGAQVAVLTRVGLVAQTSTDQAGKSELKVANAAGARLVVTAAGFETKSQDLDDGPATIHLNLAAQSDSVRVVGSAIDVLERTGRRLSVITGREIRGNATSRSHSICSDICPVWR